MKQDTLKDIQKLGKEHKKLKTAIIDMCEQLDEEKDLKQKEVIKKAVETSRNQLDDIEYKYQQLLDKF